MRTDGRDEWMTPTIVFMDICEYWNTFPAIDLFASLSNKHCPFYYDELKDALKQDWYRDAMRLEYPPTGWLQPPYSQPILTLSIEKAIEEARKGFTSLFLLPDWTDRGWFDLLRLNSHYKHWRDPRPHIKTHRVKFIPPDGIKRSSPRYGNVHGYIGPDTV